MPETASRQAEDANLVTLPELRAAADVVREITVPTPLLGCPWHSDGRLWLKPENLQTTGSFKIRGAYNAISRLDAKQRAAGVITHSSGNHAQALAYAARHIGVSCVVVMPDDAKMIKVDATRSYGAEVIQVSPAERIPYAEKLAVERGMTLVPPFDHRDVIAGQSSVGIEIAEELPDVEVVLVPVGGGGLSSGVSSALKAIRPATKVIGVEPELAGDAAEGLAIGERQVWPASRTGRTIADGLRTNLSALTFAHLSARLDDIVTVPDADIIAAVRTLARHAHLVVEPSGAATVAAYLYHPDRLPSGRTVAVLSGGNVDDKVFAEALG
ncbi:MAG: threonine ammonia-lyase [Stackebrandtia sp.]